MMQKSNILVVIKQLQYIMSLEIKYSIAQNPAQLYDYTNTQSIQQHILNINDSTLLYRNHNNYLLKQEKDIQQGNKNSKNSLKNQYKQVLKIFKIKNRWLVTNVSEQDFCAVVQPGNDNPQKNAVQLKQKSIIRLGKSKLEVLKIKYDKQKRIKVKTYYDQKLFNMIQQKNMIGEQYYSDSSCASTIDEAPFCRYCYQKSFQQENLLRILCKCEGSTKYVHEICLRNWVCQKSNYKQVKPGVYYAERAALKCEICRENFQIEDVLPCFNNQMKQYVIFVLDFQKVQTCWIVKLSQIEDTNIIVGRKFQNAIMIPDISVSREHCCLHWDFRKGVLTLTDLDSKFGTIIKKDYIQINKSKKAKSKLQIDKQTVMQLGRIKLQFRIIPEQKLFKKIKSLLNFSDQQ